ncbi:MAG TPA: helix-turn-helix transcriptional regulator [Thermomicrobiales bacterium]|jgi:DNA-binding CsgD family transcriptional regulator
MFVTHVNGLGRRPALLSVAGSVLGHAARYAKRIGTESTPYAAEVAAVPTPAVIRNAERSFTGSDVTSAPVEPPAVCAAPVHGLTRREHEVLHLLVAGHTDPQIADRLCISPRTASWHVGRILAKLGTPSRTSAAIAAVRLGLA